MCLFPPASAFHFPIDAAPFAVTAPLYPVVTGLIEFFFRIGYSPPFPTGIALGAHCSTAYVAMYHWSVQSHVVKDTVRLGFFAWAVLVIGAIMMVRTLKPARSGWEIVLATMIAVTPPVFMCLNTYFHPQDLITVGLILIATWAITKNRFALAGVSLGLALCTQQFALLIVIPLFMVTPSYFRKRFVLAIAATAAAISVPLMMVTSGSAARAVLFGSSRITLFGSGIANSHGGALIALLHVHGPSLFAISRGAPIILAVVITATLRRRYGSRVIEPLALSSLVGLSFCMRLVFEENLFGYYFMAVATVLLVQAAMTGVIRDELVVWLSLCGVAFNPIPPWLLERWSVDGLNPYLVPSLVAVFLVARLLVRDVRAREFHWRFPIAMLLVGLTGFPELWGLPQTARPLPSWAWQLILVPVAIWLVALPLGLVTGSPSPSRDSPAPVRVERRLLQRRMFTTKLISES